MVNGGAGKGDKYRPCDKKRFDRNHVMAFGIPCKNCQGTGKVRVIYEGKLWHEQPYEDCPFCDGLGKRDRFAR